MALRQYLSNVSSSFLILFAVSNFSTAGTLTSHRGFNLGPLNASDVRTLYGLGSDLVRLQIFLDGTADNLAHLATVESWFPILDPVVFEASRLGMTAVIDLHHPRPGKGKNDIDNRAFVSDWTKLSKHFASLGSTNGVWYDLWNEPPKTPTTRDLLTEAAKAIRKNGDVHPIVVPMFGSTTKGVDTAWKPLEGVKGPQVLGTHFWDWPNVQMPDNLVKGVPQNYGNPGRDRGEMIRLLDTVAATASSYNVPVLIGEVGMFRDHPDADKFFTDFFRVIDRRHPDFSVAIHAWREWSGWNYENSASWRAIEAFMRVGRTSGQASNVVPEPTSVSLILTIMAMTSIIRKRSRCQCAEALETQIPQGNGP